MSELLLLTPQLPYPPHQGTSLRNYHIIRGLAERHAITLLSFVTENQNTDPETLAPLLVLCREVRWVHAPPRRSSWKRVSQMLTSGLPDMAWRLFDPAYELALAKLLQQRAFDIVQIEGIEMARFMPVVAHHQPDAKIVFDAHNAEALLQRRALEADLGRPRRWPAAFYSWVQSRRLRRFEAQASRRADWVTAVSATDEATLFAQMGAITTPTSVIPNCIDVQAYADPPDAAAAPPAFDIVFIGKMDYRPNVDAVLWFATEVWPAIREARPATTWAIVGQKPHARLTVLRQMERVTVTGWVEEVQPYLRGAKVFVMPFRVGSGTRLKLIEAFAAGKAVVSTTLGVEGYPVRNGQELLLADRAQEMVEAVLFLLENAGERIQLGTNALAFARHYDWRVIIPRFDVVYEALLPTPKPFAG